MFDDLSDLHEASPEPSSVSDELTAYLEEGRKRVDDVIRWWINKQTKYPRLSQMALDYHNVPGKL
jgi:hypothetical protein